MGYSIPAAMGAKTAAMDKQNILLQLNIADDYFKAKKQISILEEELQEMCIRDRYYGRCDRRFPFYQNHHCDIGR